MIDGNGILTELEQVTYQRIRAQYNERMAIECCSAMCLCLKLNFETGSMYIPQSHRRDELRKAEYRAIFNDFSERNYKELAIKYGRTEQSIYKIIARCLAEHRQKHQNDLFPVSEQEVSRKYVTAMVIEDYMPAGFIGCGVSSEHAHALGVALFAHLTAHYPGVSVVISNEAVKRHLRDERQGDLFSE